MPTFRANTAVDPAQISGAFDSIAKAFAPPSPQEVYAAAKAKETQQRNSQIADLYAYAADPNFNQGLLDRRAGIAGAYSPNQSLTAVGMNNATTLQANAADNARALQQTGMQEKGALDRAMVAPVSNDATRFTPPSIASAYAVPQRQIGVVKMNEGQTAALPDGRTIMGTPKPLSEAEAKGVAFARLSPEEQADAAYGSTPVEQIIRNGMPQIVPRRQAIGATPALAPAAPSNVKRLIDERAALPAGDPRIAEYDAAIAAEGRGATADPYRNATDTALAKRHADLVTAGASAAGMSANLDALEPLLEGVPTGALAQRKVEIARYAADVGLQDVADALTGGKLDQAQAATAIVQRLAPSLRVPGSGAQSDRELKNFLDSLPSLQNTPGGNRLIIGTLRGAAQHAQRTAAIARQAQAGNLDKFEAERQIAALPSPFARFAEPQNGAQAQGGTPSPSQQPVRVSTPDEARKLPSGTPILLPDGTTGRVP